MKQVLLSLLTLSFTFVANSAPTWTFEKDVMTRLGIKGCVAQVSATAVVNGQPETWTLQVVSLETGNGDYTYHPITLSFPEHKPVNEYYEAAVVVKGKKFVRDFDFKMLQTESGDKSIVSNTKQDREEIMADLSRGNSATVDFMVSKEDSTRSVEFSLSGSSAAIKELKDKCSSL